jgi:CheY-like chemotaxis protein
MRILIVEDDAMFAFAIEDALTVAGHEIVGFARDENSAVELADRERPDLALVDLRLARHSSGAIAARDIRERYNIPSIFISSSPEDCRKEAKPSGAWGCLSKPFTDKDLVNVVAIAATMMTGGRPDLRPRGFELYTAA